MLKALLNRYRMRRRINRHVRRLRERAGLRVSGCPVLTLIYRLSGS